MPIASLKTHVCTQDSAETDSQALHHVPPMIYALMVKSGVENTHLHSLRHTSVLSAQLSDKITRDTDDCADPQPGGALGRRAGWAALSLPPPLPTPPSLSLSPSHHGWLATCLKGVGRCNVDRSLYCHLFAKHHQ